MCFIYLSLSMFENKINKVIFMFGYFTWLKKKKKHSASSIFKLKSSNVWK